MSKRPSILLYARSNVELGLMEPGLFYHGSELCVKTEYRTERGAIEAYIVSSGEFFWGGTDQVALQRRILVQPVSVR